MRTRKAPPKFLPPVAESFSSFRVGTPDGRLRLVDFETGLAAYGLLIDGCIPTEPQFTFHFRKPSVYAYPLRFSLLVFHRQAPDQTLCIDDDCSFRAGGWFHSIPAERFDKAKQLLRTAVDSLPPSIRTRRSLGHDSNTNDGESGRDGRIAPATPPTPPGMRLRTGRFQ